MASRRTERSTAGAAASRLGDEDGWGTCAARSWSSSAAVESSTDVAAAALPRASPLPGVNAGAAGPAVGSTVRVWWPRMQQWYEGTVVDTGEQDGADIYKIVYRDDTEEWRALGEATWELLHAPEARTAARAVRVWRLLGELCGVAVTAKRRRA